MATTYLLVYHGGGGMGQSEEENQKIMAQWGEWMGKVGPNLADGGKPVMAQKTIAANGSVSDGGGAGAVNGYSLLTADSFDQAIALAKSCPHLAAGGTIQVCECADIPGM